MKSNSFKSFARKNIVVIFLVMLCLGFGIGTSDVFSTGNIGGIVKTSSFLSASNIVNLTTQMAINAMLSAGLTYVIILGGIDISVGSVAALAGIVSMLVAQKLPNVSVFGAILVLVLSASMSTLSSLVLTSGSTMTLDLIAPLSKKPMTEKSKMISIRVLVAFFVLVSALIAIFQERSTSGTAVTFIADLMGVSWGVLAGSFIAPFLYGLYMKKVSKASVYVSFALGVSIGVVQLVKSLVGFSFGVSFLDEVFFKSSIHSGSFAMILGLILVPIISLFTKRQDKEQIDAIFSCYDRQVTASAKAVLTDMEKKG